MREIRQSGSEGGAVQTNAPFLPLSHRVSGHFIVKGLTQPPLPASPPSPAPIAPGPDIERFNCTYGSAGRPQRAHSVSIRKVLMNSREGPLRGHGFRGAATAEGLLQWAVAPAVSRDISEDKPLRAYPPDIHGRPDR